MSHRRTKGIEYDDDEVADYSDEYAEDTQKQEGMYCSLRSTPMLRLLICNHQN